MDGIDGGVRRAGVEVAHDDVSPLASEGECTGAAEAGAGAGDDGDPIFEAHGGTA